MWLNFIVLALLGAVVFSLGSAMVYLVREPHGSKKTVRALTWRIGLSLAVFLLLVIGYLTGLLEPHGIGG
jgi:hypothetical protein